MFKCVTSLPWVLAMVWGLVTEKKSSVIQEPLHLRKNECHSYIARWNVDYFLNVYFFSPSKFPGTSGETAADRDGTQICDYFPKSPSLLSPYWDVYNHAGCASPTQEHSTSTSPRFDITFMPATFGEVGTLCLWEHFSRPHSEPGNSSPAPSQSPFPPLPMGGQGLDQGFSNPAYLSS